jgi:hypothetical protein
LPNGGTRNATVVALALAVVPCLVAAAAEWLGAGATGAAVFGGRLGLVAEVDAAT